VTSAFFLLIIWRLGVSYGIQEYKHHEKKKAEEAQGGGGGGVFGL
jgi:hypothetical protein